MENEEGGGGFLSGRILGLPPLVWVAIIAVLAFLYFKGRKGATGTAGAVSQGQAAGSTATLSTGDTTIQPGAVAVSVNAGGSGDTGLAGTASGGPAVTSIPDNTGTVSNTSTGTSSSPTVNTNPQPQPPAPPPSPVTVTSPGPLVTVPKVVGEQANFAIGNLSSVGLTWKESTPPRNPKYTYITTSQSPSAGTKIPKGSPVTVAFQQHTYPGE